MTTQEGNNAVVARHLEALANAAKEYTLAELANISVSGESYTLPTASATVKGGVKIGDGLQMDGDTLSVTLQSGSSGGGYIIGSNVSSVEGGFWQDTINDVPVLKLRHGDYEYNFKYDEIISLGSMSAPLANTTPNTYVLGTASVSADGGVWYEVNNNVPTLKLHAGNYNYGFNYDTITYKGSNSNLVAYLPFDSSPTSDACGNTWTKVGNPSITQDHKLESRSETGYLYNDIISGAIGAQPWTIDFWGRVDFNDWADFFQTFNGNYDKVEDGKNFAVILRAYPEGTIGIPLGNNTRTGTPTDYSYGGRHHYAVSYDGTTIRAFVDGTLVITYEIDITLSGRFVIGRGLEGYYGAVTYIDHFRIWRTALWTENFTPPTAADYL